MISKTSFRNWIVFKAAIKRLKWLSILYGVALFLELPLLLWMELSKQKSIQGNLWAEVANKSYLPQMLFNSLEPFVNVAVSIIFGLIIFHYLQKDKASTFFHSLPIKRGILYGQNLLAGLVLIWLPIVINGLLIYGVFSVFGVTEGQWHNPYDAYGYSPEMELIKSYVPSIIAVWQLVAFWLFLSMLMTGLFYIFTVFVGMLTGNVLLQGALTFIGLILPMGLYVLMKYNLWRLLYGFPRDINSRTIEGLSPLIAYLNNQNYRFLFETSTWYIWYFGAALLLVGVSIYLYKIRNAEAAGETLVAGWIRWIFKYGVAVCSALTGGLYFSTLNENSTGVLYLGYFIGAVLGYSIADMIAYKSFHFYKRWRGMAIFGAVFILLIFSVKLDFYGYQKFVPDQDAVKEVFVSSLNREGSSNEGLTGEDNIRVVRELHRQIIKLEKENRALENSNRRVNYSGVRPVDTMSTIRSTDITYVLDNGRKVKRTYNIDINQYREFLYPIFNSQEAKKTMYGRLFKLDEGKIDQINVNNYHLAKNIRIYKREEINQALAALRKDVLNVTYEAAMEGKAPSQANIDLLWKIEDKRNYGSYNLNYYPEFKNFEAFLAERDYLGDLFINPTDVSTIIINKVGTDETVEVNDKIKIKDLLNWCNLEDERAFMMRQQQPENKEMVEYYGKVVMNNGSPMFIIFDGSRYAQQMIDGMMNER